MADTDGAWLCSLTDSDCEYAYTAVARGVGFQCQSEIWGAMFRRGWYSKLSSHLERNRDSFAHSCI